MMLYTGAGLVGLGLSSIASMAFLRYYTRLARNRNKGMNREWLLHTQAQCHDSVSCVRSPDRDGNVQDAPPVADELAQDPNLAGLKLVAWAADDSLLPRTGERGFPHWGRWAERNKRFTRDVVQWFAQGALVLRLLRYYGVVLPTWCCCQQLRSCLLAICCARCLV